jgi:hypothetical protein
VKQDKSTSQGGQRGQYSNLVIEESIAKNSKDRVKTRKPKAPGSQVLKLPAVPPNSGKKVLFINCPRCGLGAKTVRPGRLNRYHLEVRASIRSRRRNRVNITQRLCSERLWCKACDDGFWVFWLGIKKVELSECRKLVV